MSIAAEVCMYLSLHGEGTRRGMSDALTRNEGSVETATRKLIELGFIREVRRIPSPDDRRRSFSRSAIVLSTSMNSRFKKAFAAVVRRRTCNPRRDRTRSMH